MFLPNFSKNYFLSAYAQSYPQIGQLVKLKGGYPYAVSRELFEKFTNLIIARDKEAILKLLATGLIGITKEGEEAYYEGDCRWRMVAFWCSQN